MIVSVRQAMAWPCSRDIINIVAIGIRPIEFRLYAQVRGLIARLAIIRVLLHNNYENRLVRELNNRMFLHVLNVNYDHMMIFVMIIDQTMCSMVVDSEMSEDKSTLTSSITLQS